MKYQIKTQKFENNIIFKRLILMISVLLIAIFIFMQSLPAYGRSIPNDGFADIVKNLLPSVVTIQAMQKIVEHKQGQTPQFNFPEGSPYGDLFEFFRRNEGNRNSAPRKQAAAGSGFIIGADGIIVTNHHVVKDASEIFVILEDKRRFKANVIGSDAGADLAVLKIDTKGEKLPILSFGNSDKARIGDWVIAIGNPWGLGGTVTAGIISARGRDIDRQSFVDFIQTDAPINQGNSGGPLFNLDGEVIGINTAIYSKTGGSIGLGFSIPSNQAKKTISQLQEFGTTKRGWLGVSIQSVSKEIAEGLGLDEAKGALISKVHQKSPAAKAGIMAGDIILNFNDEKVPNSTQLRRMVASSNVGIKVPLKIWRNNKIIDLVVILGEREKVDVALLSDNKEIEKNKGKVKSVELLGLKLSKITNYIRKKFNLDDDINGVVIIDVKADSDAATKRLAPGMVIVKVNQKIVKTPKDVINITKQANEDGRGSVLLWINRNGEFSFIPVKLSKK